MVTLKQATDDLVKAKMEPYVMALGKVAHAWNYLQEALGQLFCAVTGLENDNTGQAIWHSVANDRAQRDMLRAAINATEDKRLNSDLPKAKDDINWPLGKANTVAEQRNNAVHGPMGLSLGSKEIELRPLWHYGNPRALKLVGKRHSHRICLVRGIRGYTHAICSRDAHCDSYQWRSLAR